MENDNYTPEKVQFNYQTLTTKYYYLTDSSGYPSADYQLFYSAKEKTGLVVPETRANSAYIGKSSDNMLGR